MKQFFVWVGYLASIGYSMDEAVYINLDETSIPYHHGGGLCLASLVICAEGCCAEGCCASFHLVICLLWTHIVHMEQTM